MKITVVRSHKDRVEFETDSLLAAEVVQAWNKKRQAENHPEEGWVQLKTNPNDARMIVMPRDRFSSWAAQAQMDGRPLNIYLLEILQPVIDLVTERQTRLLAERQGRLKSVQQATQDIHVIDMEDEQ